MRRLRETRTAEYVIQSQEWPPQGQWTYADYARLPDDGWKYEVIRGELHMAPAPRPVHQRVVLRLAAALDAFVRSQRRGEVFTAPIDVILPDNLGAPVQPDVLFLAPAHLDRVKERWIQGVPDLVVEVLSPSNWVDDRRVKFEVYAQAGVPEYWIVDPDLGSVEVFVLEGGAYRLLDRFGPGDSVRSQILPDFTIPVEEIFSA